MTELAIVASSVMDMFNDLQRKPDYVPIDWEKADYNFYGDHKVVRPYNTVLEGVNWYLNQPEVEHLPEELIINLVAHNFGITPEEAVRQVETSVKGESGIVEFN